VDGMNNKTTEVHVSLPVMEHFYTIQGEGFNQGRAAYFIRLGGCDVGCVWCDVKDSWDAENHPKLSIEEIIVSINKFTNKGLVVITGGEPLMHNLNQLTERLKLEGFETSIETSASHPFSGKWDWVCISPKKFKSPIPDTLVLANELKVVIFNKSDFDWAEKYAALVNKDCKLYLQPEWDKSSIVTPLIIEYIKNNPKWELSIQLHKIIDVP
jgi:7-carboxy-7-deazaguanine synthase